MDRIFDPQDAKLRESMCWLVDGSSCDGTHASVNTVVVTSQQSKESSVEVTTAGFQELEEYLAKLEGSRVVAW